MNAGLRAGGKGQEGQQQGEKMTHKGSIYHFDRSGGTGGRQGAGSFPFDEKYGPGHPADMGIAFTVPPAAFSPAGCFLF